MQNGESENQVVTNKPYRCNNGYPVPFGRQPVQHTKHHKVDDIAVCIADSDAQYRHDAEANAGQQGVDQIEERGDKQKQEFDRFGGAANHAGHHTGDQQAFDLMTILRAGAVIDGQGSTWQTTQERRHFTL